MKKTTRRALFLSFASMFLCFTMLLGTTYAWFTDSVESGVNTIVAGNLDIELVHTNKTVTTPETVEGNEELFLLEEGQLWEPGAMVWENFTVKNEGDLALKYQFTLNATPVGEKDLTKVLKVAVVEDGVLDTDTRETLKGKTYTALETFSLSGEMTADADDVTYGIVIYWEPSNNDNEYNMNNTNKEKELSVDIKVNLFATQLEAESDSFGTDYDAGAPWTGSASIDWYTDASDDATEFTLTSAEDLAGLAAIVNGTAVSPVTTLSTNGSNTIQDGFKGKTIVLESDIDLNNIEWTPIGNASHGFNGTFDGKGFTIYNLNVTGDTSIGLFGYLLNGGNIKNLTVENATVSAKDYAGAILGRGYTDVVNCHVKNVTVTVTPYFDEENGVYDGGAKAGGVVGQLLEGAGNTVVGCTATNVYIKGYRDLGGVLGMAHNNNSVENCSAENVTIEYVSVDGTYDDGVTPNQNAGAVVGRINASATVDEATLAGNANFTLVKRVSASTNAEMTDAINNGATVLDLAEGNYTMPATSNDVTISGTADTKIDLGKCGAENVTFNGVTVHTTGYYGGLIDSDTIVYNNCIIDGPIYLYGEKVVFNNCTFEYEDNNDYLWVYAVKNAEFNNCTFNTTGKAILVFQDGSAVDQTVTVKGCTFNATQAAYNWDKTIHIAAVSIDGSQGGTYNVILENNTVDADFNGLWQDKTSAGNITVTVAGEKVLKP